MVDDFFFRKRRFHGARTFEGFFAHSGARAQWMSNAAVVERYSLPRTRLVVLLVKLILSSIYLCGCGWCSRCMVYTDHLSVNSGQ